MSIACTMKVNCGFLAVNLSYREFYSFSLTCISENDN